jgi:glycosyltransferase involved in cell wall biosynthesis
MKILFHAPAWGNLWIDPIINVLSSTHQVKYTSTQDGNELVALSEDADLLLSGWCNEITSFWSNNFGHKKIVTFLRRYEIYCNHIRDSINWNNINDVIFVSNYWKNTFNKTWHVSGPKTHVVPNGIDVNCIPFDQNRKPGDKIAMVCQLRAIKNIPLAAQILLELPGNYTIHHAGLESGEDLSYIIPYLGNLGVLNRFKFYGSMSREELFKWLKDKNYILSTSINEGNPNNVIEAMAMGIKPIIHNWPGAKDQFGPTFGTPSQAANMIQSPIYTPIVYRNHVIVNFGIQNFNCILGIINNA